jgi:hypothetical protein
MNYQRIYDNLIISRRTLNRSKSDSYYESHHIIPLCLDGCKRCKDNLILLTPREHFLAHWLLSRIHPNNNKIQYAFWCMCIASNKEQSRSIFSSIAYEESRQSYKKIISERMKGLKGYWKGKIRLDRSGNKHPMFGKGHLQLAENNPMYGKPAPNRRRVRIISENIIFDSLKQAANHLNVSVSTVCSWAQKNKLVEYVD